MAGLAGIEWNKLRSFHAAAEAGSLTAAAEALGMSQSAVSRHIAALEHSIGVMLFHRHARGLALTAAGQTLQRATNDMAAAAAFADSAIKDAHDRPQGEPKVTAPVALGTQWLVPRLPAFTRAFPDVRLNLVLDDRALDLSRFEAEAAIRLWAATDPEVVQRKLLTVRTSLFASKSCLDANGGPPASAEDLDRHKIIAWSSGEASPMRELDWAARIGRDDRPPRVAAIVVNNVQAMMKAIEAGLGIGPLPEYMIEDKGPLIRVLPDLRGPSFEVYFTYPAELRRSKRIEAFRTFLLEQIQAWGG